MIGIDIASEKKGNIHKCKMNKTRRANVNPGCRQKISTNVSYNTTFLNFLSYLSATQRPLTLMKNILFNDRSW